MPKPPILMPRPKRQPPIPKGRRQATKPAGTGDVGVKFIRKAGKQVG